MGAVEETRCGFGGCGSVGSILVLFILLVIITSTFWI
ncbi:YjcZ family sporulation protein [Paenibacillus sp. N3/727]|nr:YjcZ family sporulation protein [Paenibacillus sp. N3/727]UNK17682.1 YjcZ family sporulation protein [Paenibacillus sp. N3/727]